MDEQPDPRIDSVIPEEIEDHVTSTTDNRASESFTVSSGAAVLSVDQDSFKGDVGSFSGLDPVRIACNKKYWVSFNSTQ